MPTIDPLQRLEAKIAQETRHLDRLELARLKLNEGVADDRPDRVLEDDYYTVIGELGSMIARLEASLTRDQARRNERYTERNAAPPSEVE